MAGSARTRRIGVTGLSGYLGGRLGRALVAAGHELVDIGRGAGVDLTEAASVGPTIAAARLDAIVHTAAANPGRAVEQFDAVNRGGSAAVAAAAAAAGVRLVHVSTDVVFDGTAAPYPDDAAVSPLNEYGRSKASAEDAVGAADPGAAIVRTSLIYGLHEVDRTTAGFIERIRAGQRVGLFVDVIRQPMDVDALAAGLVRLATDLAEVAGTCNLAGRQALDRASFQRRLLEFWCPDGERWADATDDVRAADLSAEIPLDLRLRLDRATELGLACPGVDELLERARMMRPPAG